MASHTVGPSAPADDLDARAERSRDRRADAMQARSVLWNESQLRRIQSCGRWSVVADGTVAVRSRSVDGRTVAGFAGLASCGSVWACPVCSRKIAAERQADIEKAATVWESLGGAIALGTFTVSHRIGNSLKSVWDAVSAGWGAVTSGSAWIRNSKTFGVEGWTRVIEVTHGANGWHVHVHAVLFLHHGLGATERKALTAGMFGRWRIGIAKHGFRSSSEFGADIKMMHGSDAAAVLSEYFTKGVYAADGSAPRSVALEAARGDLKESRGGTRTPFVVLQEFCRWGDVDDLAIWHEWERGSKGRRQMAWSKGFRTFVGLVEDQRSDEEIAADEIGTAADDVAIISKAGWAWLRHRQWDVLDVCELAGPAGLTTWLDALAVEWWPPGRSPA